jgi:hypothetical protein
LEKIGMSSSIPALPCLRHLPFYLSLDCVTGYLFGKLSQVNPKLTTIIFAIRALAHSSFHLLANLILRGKDLQSQKIFLVSATIVNMTFLVVLRELNIIGRFFSCLLGLAVIGHLVHRVRYIQDQERRLFEAEQLLLPEEIVSEHEKVLIDSNKILTEDKETLIEYEEILTEDEIKIVEEKVKVVEEEGKVVANNLSATLK